MTRHLAPELLAQLADHGRAALAPAARRHLASCRQCQDAVIEATATGREFAGGGAPPPPAGLVAEIAGRASERPRRRSRGLLTAAVPLAAALVFFLTVPGLRNAGPPAAWTAPIAGALAAPAHDTLVFPGVELRAPAPEARRGDGTDEAIVRAIASLAAAYQDGSGDAVAATWLVGGYLALDDLPAARAFAADALRRHPRDGPLQVAAAVVAYRLGDLPRAHALLRRAQESGHDTAASRLDLAIVLRDLGQPQAARQLLEPLLREAPRAVADRAAAVLAAPSRL